MKKWPLVVSLLMVQLLFADVMVLAPQEDVHIISFGGGEGLNTFMKFKIDTLAPGKLIDSVILTVFVYQINTNWDRDVKFWNVNNQTWTEADSSKVMWNSPTSDTILQTTGFASAIGWNRSIDLKPIFLRNYNVGQTYCSIKIKDPDDPTFMLPPGSMPFDRNETLGVGNRAFGQHIYLYPHEFINGCPLLSIFYTNPGDVGEIELNPADNKLRLEICPNPFQNALSIKFQIPSTKSQINSKLPAILKIYDAVGRLVRQWDDQTIRLSDKLIWAGNDEFNNRVPKGVYFITLESQEGRLTKKAILLK